MAQVRQVVIFLFCDNIGYKTVRISFYTFHTYQGPLSNNVYIIGIKLTVLASSSVNVPYTSLLPKI